MVKGNTTGGKNYKKSKNGGSTKKPYPELEKDQLVARVIKNFGNRNLQCYCNDGKTRICHIRGAMRNRIWVNVGDFVIISLRRLAKDAEDEKADILVKYEAEHIHRVKQEPGINQNLFKVLETSDTSLDNLFEGENDTGIDFDRSEEKMPESEDETADIDIDKI